MNWNCEGHIITDDIINYVKNILKVDFPDDFLSAIKNMMEVIQILMLLLLMEVMRL